MFLAMVSLKPEMRASSGADAVLTSAPTALTQSSTTASSFLREQHLVDVVLILADADRLRLDPHELGQRILQAARDRDRAAQRHVEIRELLRRQLGGGIDRRAGLGHHDLGEPQLRQTRDQIAGELVGLARRGAVADRDRAARRAARTAAPSVRSAPFPVVARFVRIDGGGVEQLAGAVDDGDLHAGADAGIEPHRDALAGRRRQQQVVQVAAEHADRLGFGLFAQPLLDVDLEAAEHLDLPRPAHGFGQPGVGGAAAVLDARARRDAPLGNASGPAASGLLRQHDGEAQESLLAAAEQREDAMRRHVPHRLRSP